MGTEYDDLTTCPKCGDFNDVNATSTIANGVCEANTKCPSCGHEDFWAYGFYKSPEDEKDMLGGLITEPEDGDIK